MFKHVTIVNYVPHRRLWSQLSHSALSRVAPQRSIAALIQHRQDLIRKQVHPAKRCVDLNPIHTLDSIQSFINIKLIAVDIHILYQIIQHTDTHLPFVHFHIYAAAVMCPYIHTYSSTLCTLISHPDMSTKTPASSFALQQLSS